MRFNNEKAIFIQIADLLTEDILSGNLKSGDRFPSARDLAVSLEVNPNTATRSLQLLADAGIAKCERGQGYFVSEDGVDVVKEKRQKKFFEDDLPQLFANMIKLDVSIEDVAKYWANYTAIKN